MEIQSAFNSGVQGLQTASNQVTEAASNIARETARTEPPVQQTLESPPPQDVTTSLVQLKVAENGAAASTRVIETADQTLGTIIDTRV